MSKQTKDHEFSSVAAGLFFGMVFFIFMALLDGEFIYAGIILIVFFMGIIAHDHALHKKLGYHLKDITDQHQIIYTGKPKHEDDLPIVRASMNNKTNDEVLH